MATALAFRTAVGGMELPGGPETLLDEVDVQPFAKIRIVADNRAGSAGPVIIYLRIMQDGEIIAQLDELILLVGAQPLTNLYDVPGVSLKISAIAVDGPSIVDVFVYGSTD
jgi:hypothetical protein